MKKLDQFLVAGITAIGLGTLSPTAAVLAQPVDDTYIDCPAGAPGPCCDNINHPRPPHLSREHLEKYHRQHYAMIHDKLQLNAEQEKAWTNYMSAIDKQAHAWKPLHRAELEKMTAPERMQAMLDRMKQHETRLSDQLLALKTFYATLTPEQQRIFDRESIPVPPRHRHGPIRK